MSANPNFAIQQRFTGAVFAGNADTLRELAAPDFVLLEGSGLPFSGEFHGADGFLAFLGLFGEAFEIEVLAPVRSFQSDDPDVIAFEFELRATVRATGKRFESSLIEVWSFREGKVASVKPHYFNVPDRA
jgi:ketosteroid isomerase-like protein